MTRESDEDGKGGKSPRVRVKTETVEESEGPASDDDDFLTSFKTTGIDVTGGGNEDTTALERRPRGNRRKPDPGEDSEDEDWTTWKKKPKTKKSAPAGGKDGKQKQMSRSERNALSKREKRAQMSSEEKEKLREKWKQEKQQRRRIEQQRRKEEEALRDLVADDEDLYDNIKANSSAGGRPSRQAKLKALIKGEPESAEEDNDNTADEDYKGSDEENFTSKKTKATARKSTGGGRKKSQGTGTSKKKASEMSEDEKIKMQEKWREEARARRARNRSTAVVKTEGEDEGSDTGKTGGKGQTRKKSQSSGRKSTSGGSRRKKVDEMSDDEREAMKAKWREEARLKRARKRDTMAPEQREEYLRVQREKKRLQRALARETMTQQEREEASRKLAERKKAERAQLTPEQKQEMAQRKILQRIEKRAIMSDDEKQALRMKAYFQRMARLASMAPEEVERRRQQRIEYLRQRRANMTAEERQLERQRQRPNQQIRVLTEAQRSKYLAKLRETYKEKTERLKQDPEQWEKVKQKWRRDRQRRKQKMEQMGKLTRKRRNYYKLERHPNETPEQRAERIRESKRLTQKRIKIKKKLAIQSLLESGKSWDEIQDQIEKPEQREERLMRKRIYKAKFNLRKRLEAVGTPQEEIEEKLKELESTYQPTYPFRPYKPRAETWDPVDPSELALLEDNNGSIIPAKTELCDTNASTSSASSIPKTPTKTPAARRGRSPKNLQVQVQQQQFPIVEKQNSHRGTTTISHTSPEYPPSVSSPAGASSCSYVSVVETPEPIHYTATPQQQQHFHQQFPMQHQHHHHHTYNQASAYSHNQPQTQTHSLQHILDSIAYQESGTTGPSIAAAGVTDGFHYQQQAIQAHDDYASSQDNYSPPESPGDDAQDYSSAAFADFSFNRPPPRSHQSKSSGTGRRPGRPRKDEPPRPKEPKGRKPGVKGQAPAEICDECGVAYSRLKLHKLHFHNPNYKDKKCQICFQEFKAAKYWYKHYIHNHQDQIPRLANKDEKDRPHMCNECGQLFRQSEGLAKHKYYRHGEGLKKENWKRCHLCPGEKLFKETVSYHSHLKKIHPEYNKGGHDCFRCDQTFPDEKKLSCHVQQVHPDSYYPCPFCQACRFTQYGLNFHFLRCTKIGKEVREEKRKNAVGIFSLDRESLPCEFCPRKVTIAALSRHYWEMHNVKEDNFTCEWCKKEFKRRDFWTVHLEEKHLKSLDDMKEMVRRLNVKSREGLVIENLKGVMGGVPRNTPGKVARHLRAEELGLVHGKKKKEEQDTGKRKRNRKKKAADDKIEKKKGVKRKITVVAEEDEQLGTEPVNKVSTKSVRNKTKGKKREESDDDDDDEEEDESWSESEDEEEDFTESEDDDDKECLHKTKKENSATKRKSSAKLVGRAKDSNLSDEDEMLSTMVKCEILSDGE